MLPLAAGAIGATRLPGRTGDNAARLSVGWAGSVLCFLSGVQRGLSFRQPGGAPWTLLAAMFLFFVCGGGAVPLCNRPRAASALLLLGYAGETIADPLAARQGRAPRYFAPLRLIQMLVPLVSLGTLCLRERDRTAP